MALGSASAVTFILCRNRPVADAFYRDVLGLKWLGDDGFAGVFDMGGARLRITEIPDHAAGPHPVLGWEVVDIVATIDALTGHGLAMTVYPGMGQDERGIWTAPGGGTKVAFFPDPDGNMLSLTQPG